MNARMFCKKHPLFSFVVLPIAILASLTVASGAAEIFIDHVILRRASNGMPLLYTLSWVRWLVTVWNLAVVYVVPVLIALGLFRIGIAQDVNEGWLWGGGLTICLLGGLHYLETRWTGIKGTSTLIIGPVSDAQTALLRISANGFFFVLGGWLYKRWRRAQL